MPAFGYQLCHRPAKRDSLYALSPNALCTYVSALRNKIRRAANVQRFDVADFRAYVEAVVRGNRNFKVNGKLRAMRRRRWERADKLHTGQGRLCGDRVM